MLDLDEVLFSYNCSIYIIFYRLKYLYYRYKKNYINKISENEFLSEEITMISFSNRISCDRGFMLLKSMCIVYLERRADTFPAIFNLKWVEYVN
jgi:hypothetical protein